MASPDELTKILEDFAREPFPQPGPNQLYARRPEAPRGSELGLTLGSPYVNRDLFPQNRASLYSNYLPMANTQNILTRLIGKSFNPLESESEFRGPLRGTANALQTMSARNSIVAPLGLNRGKTGELARSNEAGLATSAERMGLQYDEKRQQQFLAQLLQSYLLGGKIYGAQADASTREQELKNARDRGRRQILGQIPIAGPFVGGLS